MKYLFLLSALLSLVHEQPTCHVKGKGYEGYIFNKQHFVMVSVPQQKSRYTPTCDDIFVAEQLLKEQLLVLNKPLINQGGECPNILKKLRKYKRQYVGFINDKGEKILWVNCVWNKDLESQISEEIISVFDGCSYYWDIKINITTGKAYDLDINGKG